MTGIVVTGTDTGIGKTVFGAGLTALLGADCGGTIGARGRAKARAGGAAWRARARPRTAEPLPAAAPRPRPRQSAAIDGVRIDVEALTPPLGSEQPLVIEGAGGLMVPLTDRDLFIDVLPRWRLPVVLCAHRARHHQSHAAVDRSAARQRQAGWRGLHRRQPSGNRTGDLRYGPVQQLGGCHGCRR
ncbi:MAG: AAA family ATPase [Rhodopseudomonas palustris]|nr:AAA family ATPase [Rhodopseudomonas palustris]